MRPAHTKVVLLFPPRASLSSMVSLLSRYGMCPAPSDSALMHMPRVVSDELMFLASSNLVPGVS